MALDTQSSGMARLEVFEHLQSKIDEDIKVRDQLKDILQDLEKQGAYSSSLNVCNPVLTVARACLAVCACSNPLNTLNAM